jgi:hypothetical protein
VIGWPAGEKRRGLGRFLVLITDIKHCSLDIYGSNAACQPVAALGVGIKI